MLETAVEVLKVPLVVLGVSGVLMALAALVADRKGYRAGQASTSRANPADKDPERKR